MFRQNKTQQEEVTRNKADCPTLPAGKAVRLLLLEARRRTVGSRKKSSYPVFRSLHPIRCLRGKKCLSALNCEHDSPR